MAYISALTAEAPLNLAILERDSEVIGRLCIGHDPEEATVYSAFVSLAEVPGQPAAHRELRFCVVEATPDGEDFRFSGTATRRYLKGDERRRVLGCIAEIARRLVDHVRPDYITMVTAETDLPQKALEKYGILCQAIGELGYQWGRGNRFLGTEIWMMTRTGQGT